MLTSSFFGMFYILFAKRQKGKKIKTSNIFLRGQKNCFGKKEYKNITNKNKKKFSLSFFRFLRWTRTLWRHSMWKLNHFTTLAVLNMLSYIFIEDRYSLTVDVTCMRHLQLWRCSHLLSYRTCIACVAQSYWGPFIFYAAP